MRLSIPILFLATANAEWARAFYDGMNQDADAIWHSPSGALVAWFRDPDGHVLSLTQFAARK